MQHTPVCIVLIDDEIQKYLIEPAAEAAKSKFNGIPADIGKSIVFQRKIPLSKKSPSICEPNQ